MSVRFLYRQLRAAERRCSYYRCQEPILRNIFRSKDRRLWHWGCWNDARDEQYRCPECYSTFDVTEAAFQEGQTTQGDIIRQQPKPVCPHCGSPPLSNVKIPMETF